MERRNAFRMRVNYRGFLLKGIVTMPLEWHTEHHTGDTIDRNEKGSSSLFNFAEDSFEVVYVMVRLVISFFVLAYFSIPVATVVAAVMFLIGVITVRMDKVITPLETTINRAENKISESMVDAITNITTIVILRIERRVYESIMRKTQAIAETFNEESRLNEWKWCWTALCGEAMKAIALALYFWLHVGGSQLAIYGTIYILFNYLGKINDLLFDFCSRNSELIRRRAKVMNAEELSVDFKSGSFTNHVLPTIGRSLRSKILISLIRARTAKCYSLEMLL